MSRLWKVLALILCFAAAASAQIDVRGQILLPNGDYPSNPVRYYLTSDDGRLNDYRFTDSTGRMIIKNLSGLISYTITVDSDGETYDRTVHSFMPSYEPTLRLTLRPLLLRVVIAPPTVSAASAYKPQARVIALYEAALKEIEKQQFDAAEKLLRQAIHKDPRFAAPQIDLGALLMQTQRHAEAEQILRQALGVDPKSTHALLNLGITLNRLNKFSDAVTPLREALRLHPGLLAARLHLGVALVELDQFAEAEPLLQRVLKTPGSEEISAHLYLGKLYARTGKYDQGIAALEIYLSKTPAAANAEEVRRLIARMKRELSARR